MSFKKWLALGVALLPAVAYAASSSQNTNPEQPYINVDALNQIDGVNVNPNTAAPGNFSTLNVTTGITTQGTVFSSGLTNNPMVLSSKLNAPVGAVNAANGQSILAGATNRTIFPLNVIIDAKGGNTSACTGLKAVCLPSGTLIGTYAAAQLTSGVPTSLFSASVTVGVPPTQGCLPGDSVYISANGGGGCATATSYDTTLIYTVQ